MNSSSDPVLAALQLILVTGLLGWWAYVGGIVLGTVVLMRRAVRLRRAAIAAIVLQFAPLVAVAILLVAAMVQLALNLPFPTLLASGLAAVTLVVGPAATLWLILTMTAGRRTAPR